MTRVSVDDTCKDGYTCPSVWIDDENDPEHAVVVGIPVVDGAVPLGAGEVAVRVRRQVLKDADLR